MEPHCSGTPIAEFVSLSLTVELTKLWTYGELLNEEILCSSFDVESPIISYSIGWRTGIACGISRNICLILEKVRVL